MHEQSAEPGSTVVECCTLDSPVGPLTIAASPRGLVAVHFAIQRHPPQGAERWRASDGSAGVLAEARAQLAAYFAGDRLDFSLPLDARGTLFQRRVWELRAIPFGETASYAEIANRLGDPAATRAVGAANGRNPIAIVVPCHRVVGANGSLTGFGGGIERKRWLLHHEAAVVARRSWLTI